MKKQIRLLGLAFVLLVMVLGACKKDVVSPDFHYDYYDLREGRFIEYDVMEIRHDNGATIQHDTMRYQLKTVIGDTVIDNEGRIARKFYRYKRENTSQAWSLSDIWTTLITENRAELVEENQRKVKLVFIPTISKVWDLNSFNMEDPLECYYRNLHEPYGINGFDFDSTITVEQEDFITFVDYRRKFETYANGVGLVNKYYKHLTIQNFDTLNVKNGDELFYELIGYGFE